ncbi:MAG: hypothetical protein K2F52_01310, partial [Malacoplasma sp.]|nr:hypothetical protein [Malacoplasma sp.]
IHESEGVVVEQDNQMSPISNNISVNVYNETNKNQIVEVTPTKKIVNEEWVIPKNIPRYTDEEIPLLTEKEKEEYREMRKCASKFGRYVEVKKYHDFYLVSLTDLLPFFLGQILSLIRLMTAYGDAKRTINFNKKLMMGIKGNLYLCLFFGLFVWPLIIIALFLCYPFFILDFLQVSNAWNDIATNGAIGIVNYFSNIVSQLFNSTNLAFTLVFWIILGMLNVQTFVYYILFKFNKKHLFQLQKNFVRLEIRRIHHQSAVDKGLI